jgi:hypothetical protein
MCLTADTILGQYEIRSPLQWADLDFATVPVAGQ